MMISPEGYYEEYLKGKTIAQIMTAIRGLKQELGRLKNALENPNYGGEFIIHPSEKTRIYCTREYLKKAKQAYGEAGGTYILSYSEKKVADFDANIDAISKITYTMSGFFDGRRTHVVDLSEGLKAYSHLRGDEEPLALLDIENGGPFTKNTFIAALMDIHIGEWRRRYSAQRFEDMVNDGTQWKLEFAYNDGHKSLVYEGDNSYPYNFSKLEVLIGIGDTEKDENE